MKWISVDPYMRARMTERKNYKPPFQINKPMEGAAIGKIIDSNSSNFSKNDVVISDYGWRDNYQANDIEIKKIEPIECASANLSRSSWNDWSHCLYRLI